MTTLKKASVPKSLNPQQREAVLTTEGPLLVLAGAGTGKTRTVTERIAYLLRSGVKPENILAVTFTNKAAGEMKERIAKLVGRQYNMKALIASTFHSLCVRILRRDAELLGYRKTFSICDQGEQLGIIRKASRFVKGGDILKPDEMLWEIGKLKNKGIGWETFARQAVEDWEQTLASVYRRYQERLRAINSFDFDDLLLKSVELLERHEEPRKYWSKRFKYISVDEFQDTNEVQYRLVESLASKWGNLCVVGDDDQSIYGWRGAVADNILGFHKRFKGAKVVRLEENYRSVNSVLKAANALIANNEKRCEKNLWSGLGPGDNIRVLVAEDQQNEAERIVTEIKKRVMQGESPERFAVIIRTNGQTRPFEEELLVAKVPYALIGGQSFFDRKEVRDVVSYLSAIANPADDGALLRIINTPARGIGDRTVEKISSYAARESISFSKALMQVQQISDISDKSKAACRDFAAKLLRWREIADGENLRKLVSQVAEDSSYMEEIEHLYDDTLERATRWQMALEVGDSLSSYLDRDPEGDLSGFIQEAALWGKEDETAKEREKNSGAVKLITAHSAKGLEFPVVYVAGLEEGLLPHKNSEEANTVDEERRLAYVAITRAQRELTLSYCQGRIVRGKDSPRTPSRFLSEIPPELLDRRDQEASQGAKLDMIRSFREKMKQQNATE